MWLVYVVCSRDGEGCSQTLHRNYLLPINSNLEQGEKDEPMVGVGNDTSPPPVPSVGNAPAESGPSGMVTSNSADNTTPGQSRSTCSTQMWHSDHQELTFHGGTKILVCWPILDQPAFGMHGLTCVSAYVSCDLSVYHFLGDIQCRTHFTGNTIYLPSMTHFSVQGNSLNATPKVDSWAGKGVDQRTFGQIATPLPEYK